MDVDPLLVQAVKARLSTLDGAQIREAISLTEKFPPPGPEPADIAAQVLHDVALHAELLADWPLVVALYQRSLAYATVSQKIPLGNWFRCGICFERMGDYRSAMKCYQRAVELEQAWPYVAAMAKRNLAYLLSSAEEYERAASLLRGLLDALPHPLIRRDEVVVELANCLRCAGKAGEALELLEKSFSNAAESDASLRCLEILAELYDESGRTEEAVACCQKIVHHGAASLTVKAAAAYRAEVLQKKRPM